MRPFEFAGGTAVVTGAASGIGAALARALAARDMDLVLLDRNAAGLAAVASAIRDACPERAVTAHVVDLADPDATTATAAAVLLAYPRIRLLVNNAGVALAGRFDQVTLDEFGWLMDINFHAVVRLTHLLLPALKAEPGSHLVNVSSVFGLMAPPGQTAYAASKFAVRGFTESLRYELAGDGVGVTSVHPGGIRTGITRAVRVGSGVPRAEFEQALARFEKLLRIEPDRAAEAILRGVGRRRGRVLIGWSARLPDLAARLLPGSYGAIVAAAARRSVPRELMAAPVDPAATAGVADPAGTAD